MKTIMIYPNSKCEKAIHNYSEDLLKEMPDVKRLTFTVKNPLTFSFLDTVYYRQIHIQELV